MFIIFHRFVSHIWAFQYSPLLLPVLEYNGSNILAFPFSDNVIDLHELLRFTYFFPCKHLQFCIISFDL